MIAMLFSSGRISIANRKATPISLLGRITGRRETLLVVLLADRGQKTISPIATAPLKGGQAQTARTGSQKVKPLCTPAEQVSHSPVPAPVPNTQLLDLFQLNHLKSFFHPPREDLQVGGKIKFHLQNWCLLTQDPHILL